MAPMAMQKQMLGGWHSEPADANYCAKQLVKCVSPHHTLKRLIYGQTESGNISAASHQQCLLLWSGRVCYWERTFISLYKACPFNHLKFFHIYLKKKVKMVLCSSLYFYPNMFTQQNFMLTSLTFSPILYLSCSFLQLVLRCPNC